MAATEPTSQDEIQVRLSTIYSDKGVKELEKDLYRLKATQIERMSKGGTLTRAEKVEQMTTSAQLTRMEKDRARAQRQVLFSGLGIMFFAMAMQRVMQGLLQPAADIAGVFDLISLILQMFFLPIMLKMIPPLLWLLKVVMGIPEPVKLAAGGMALLVYVLSSFVAFLGTLVLGLQSLGFVGIASTITGAIQGMATAIAGALASPLIIIGLVIAAFWALDGALRSLQTTISEFLTGLMPQELMKTVGSNPLYQQYVGGFYNEADKLLGAPGSVIKDIPVIGGAAQGIGQAMWDWGPGMIYNAGRSVVSVIINNATGINSNTNVEQTTSSGNAVTTSTSGQVS